MMKVIQTFMSITSNDVGLIVFSTEKQKNVSTLNSKLIVPLASAGKIVIGYCIAKWVQQGKYQWSDRIEQIRLDPHENSRELYPHFQGRDSLSLGDAVEVMISCHDNEAAISIVQFCGGWELLNKEIRNSYNNINITSDPRDLNNNGELKQVLEVLSSIYSGYKANPEVWKPIINGLVRPVDLIEGIPSYHLNHMSGGLENLVIDIGIVGNFHQEPYLYVMAANNLESRYTNSSSDEKIEQAMKLIYEDYLYQEQQLTI